MKLLKKVGLVFVILGALIGFFSTELSFKFLVTGLLVIIYSEVSKDE